MTGQSAHQALQAAEHYEIDQDDGWVDRPDAAASAVVAADRRRGRGARSNVTGPTPFQGPIMPPTSEPCDQLHRAPPARTMTVSQYDRISPSHAPALLAPIR